MVKRTLASGSYEAEFFTDQWADPPLVHYIVTRRGETDILAWGQERTMSDAERAAMDCMRDLHKRHTATG